MQLSAFSGLGFLGIHPDNVQSADSQATQAGAFPQIGFLGWDFHCDFSDKYVFMFMVFVE